MELTPKQKAKELFEWIYLCDEHINDEAFTMTRNAALILTQHMIIEVIKSQPKLVNAAGYGNAMFANPMLEYWNQVKLELENIIF